MVKRCDSRAGGGRREMRRGGGAEGNEVVTGRLLKRGGDVIGGWVLHLLKAGGGD